MASFTNAQMQAPTPEPVTPTPTPAPAVAPSQFSPINSPVPGLDPGVMNATPSLFAAASVSNLNAAQIQMINQISGTIQNYKKFSALPIQQAKEQYKTLHPDAKRMLIDMYGPQGFTNEDNFVMQAVKLPWNIVKTAATGVGNPLIALYKMAKTEGQIINAPYMFGRELTQGASVWDTSTYSKAWDGRNVFDTGALKSLTEKYGQANTVLMEGLLKGQTPGKILDSYGKVDQDMYKALANMYSGNPEFTKMYEEYKFAQVNPGNDAARVMYNTPMKGLDFTASTKVERTSGWINAFYELGHDPLTYVGGGFGNLIKGVKGAEATTIGARAAETLLGNADIRAANAEKIFAPGTKIATSWDNLYGPLVKKIAIADTTKDAEAKASVMRDIERDAPDINNRDFLNLLVKAKAFDANGMKEFVKTRQGAEEIHMGLIDGPIGMRMGIPVARRERQLTSGVNRVLRDFFNGGTSFDTVDGLGVGTKAFEEMLKVGRATDPIKGTPGSAESPLLNELFDQMNIRRRIARMAQTHPGRENIGVMDHNVDMSIPTVKRYLRLAYPRYAADAMAERFKYANPVDRTTFVRGMYDQIMLKMGLDEPARRAVLEHKFADTTTFANAVDTKIAPQHLEEWIQTSPLTHAPEEANDALYSVTTNGPLHAFQGKPQIGGLDFTGPELAPYGINFSSPKSSTYLLNETAGGVLRSAFLRKLTNLWAAGSVIPRMGMRGTIEQGLFHYLTAPSINIIKWSQGRGLNKLGADLTGDVSRIPYGARLRMKIFGIDPKKYIPTKSVYEQMGEEEKKIIQGRMDKGIINGEEVWTAANMQDVVSALNHRINKVASITGANPDDLKVFLKYPSSASHSAAVNSVMSRSILHQGITAGELERSLLTKDGVARLLDELGISTKGTRDIVDPAAFVNDIQASATHYRNWAPMFQDFNVLDGFHFGANFIKHNALRTGKDFANARDAILKRFGVDPETKKIVNREAFNKYRNFSMQTGRDVLDKNMTEVQSVIERIQVGLQDMYTLFHGSPIQFNDRLFNAIKTFEEEAVSKASTRYKEELIAANKTGDINEITDAALRLDKAVKAGFNLTRERAIRKGLNNIQPDNFQELTSAHRMSVPYKSDLDFANKDVWAMNPKEQYKALVQAMKRWGEGGITGKGLHYMDMQINQMFNQPAFDVAKLRLWQKYKPFVEDMVNDLHNREENPYTLEQARAIAEEHYVNRAEKNAAAMVNRFVDTADKQSTLSYTMRTSGRFYRAQEQFLRRTLRIGKDFLPRALWRERLLNLGIDNMGFLHKDNKGDPYFSMPADNILYHGVNGFLNFIMMRPADTVSGILPADFNMNLMMSNPSLTPDAGVPALSGPVMSIPILGLKSIFKDLPWGWSQEASTTIDKALLGSRSANLTGSKLLPVFVQRLLEMLPKDEQDQQVASAAAMSIAHNAANGVGSLTPLDVHNMTQEQYVTAARTAKNNAVVTANNVLFLRAILGMLTPISPTMAEASKGVPTAVRNAGINSLSQEFNDVLQGVLRNSTGLADPYEVALGAFTKDYPGRTVFTTSRNDKALSLLQSYTSDMQGWMQQNKRWVGPNADQNTANAALIFAPHIGQFDPETYLWMQSTGKIKQKSLDQYMQDVLTAQDNAAYQNAKMREELSTRNMDPAQFGNRAQIIADAKAEQQALLSANPELALTIGDSQTQITKYTKIMASLGSLLDPKSNFPMNESVRKKMTIALNLVQNGIHAMQNDTAQNGYTDVSAWKAQYKTTILNAVAEVGGAAKPGDAATDPQIAEAIKSIFKPLLDNLAKTTLKP